MRNTFPIMLLILFLHFSFSTLYSCTTAVISGRVTPDGRPLLFKQRDSDFIHNHLMYFTDGRFDYIGLVNSSDSLGSEVWAGCNSAGFAIVNSAAYNLNLGDSTKTVDREGVIMKHALQTCRSLEEFENLLRTLPKPLGADANFGVIDARGGAAYYETGNYTFSRWDVNDSSVAPSGYLIRTNYAFSGIADSGYGYVRYATAEKLFHDAYTDKNLTPEFLLRDVSRCLQHSLTGINLWQDLPANGHQPRFVNFRDFIPRYSSTSAMAIQGIRKDEKPEMTTLWTILGFPLSSVVVPVWIAGGAPLPEVVRADTCASASGFAPLCEMALILKNRCFPLRWDGGNFYLNLSALINQQQTGILQKLQPLESDIFAETRALRALRALLENGRLQEIEPVHIQEFYKRLDEKIRREYHGLFNLND
jgi:hypothetical protein